MAKKQIQLQVEVQTNEGWHKLLKKEGLIVVDVYSEWCGPCTAMQATLKKVKMEFGGDNLVLAIACADHIAALERFRQKSEPTWIFLSRGKLVNLMFGADAPKLTLLMIEELKNEDLAQENPDNRTTYEINELMPDEKIRLDVKQKQIEEAEQREILRKEQILRDRRLAVAHVVLRNIPKYGVILVFPHAKNNAVASLSDHWELAQLSIASTEKPKLTISMIDELLYFAEEVFSPQELTDLTKGQAFAYTVKHNQGDEFTGDIDNKVLQLIYGESKCPPGTIGSPAQILQGKVPVSDIVDKKNPLVQTPNAKYTPEIVSKSQPIESKSSDLQLNNQNDEMQNTCEDDFLPVTGVWAPPNNLAKAIAIKLLFPKLYDPIAVPEPEPEVPHIAIAFEAFKRKEVVKLINEYPNDVMRYGFFNDDKPESAQLIAKNLDKFEKIRITNTTYTEKLVVQLSQLRSEVVGAFAQLGPTFVSMCSVDGEEHCKMFFGESYDNFNDEESTQKVEEAAPVKKKKKGKKHKEDEVTEDPSAVSLSDLQVTENELDPGEPDEAEGEVGEIHKEENVSEIPESEDTALEVDKATSPMPEPILK